MGIYGVGGEWGKNTSVCLLTSVSKKKIRNVFPLSLLRNTIMRAPRALRFGGVRGFGGLWRVGGLGRLASKHDNNGQKEI